MTVNLLNYKTGAETKEQETINILRKIFVKQRLSKDRVGMI